MDVQLAPNLGTPLEETVKQFNNLRSSLIRDEDIGKYVVIATNGIVYPPTTDLTGIYQFLVKRINNEEVRFNNKNFLVLMITENMPSSLAELSSLCIANGWKDSLTELE
jgi:hypothetical protein